jgi:hypothetical protein
LVVASACLYWCCLACFLQDLSPKTAANAALFRANSSTRRLQRTWRRFAITHKTTAQLARTFVAQGVTYISLATDDSSSQAAASQQQQQQSAAAPAPGLVMIGGMSAGSSVRHARFEDFADKLQAPATLRAAQVGATVPARHRASAACVSQSCRAAVDYTCHISLHTCCCELIRV